MPLNLSRATLVTITVLTNRYQNVFLFLSASLNSHHFNFYKQNQIEKSCELEKVYSIYEQVVLIELNKEKKKVPFLHNIDSKLSCTVHVGHFRSKYTDKTRKIHTL